MAEPAGHKRQAEHQNGVGEDRADQGRLHDGGQAGPQGEQADQQLRQVSQGRLEQPGRPRSHPFAHLVDGLPDQSGGRRQGQSGQHEAGDRVEPYRGRDAGDGREQGGGGDGDPVDGLQMAQVGRGEHGPC